MATARAPLTVTKKKAALRAHQRTSTSQGLLGEEEVLIPDETLSADQIEDGCPHLLRLLVPLQARCEIQINPAIFLTAPQPVPGFKMLEQYPADLVAGLLLQAFHVLSPGVLQIAEDDICAAQLQVGKEAAVARDRKPRRLSGPANAATAVPGLQADLRRTEQKLGSLMQLALLVLPPGGVDFTGQGGSKQPPDSQTKMPGIFLHAGPLHDAEDEQILRRVVPRFLMQPPAQRSQEIRTSLYTNGP